MSFAFGVEDQPNEVPYVKLKGTKFGALPGEYHPYPKMKYHPEDAPDGRVVDDAEEEESLGEGWLDSPVSYRGPHAPSREQINEARRARRK